MDYELRPPAGLSFPSLAALGVAVASIVVSCCGHGFAGLMLAFAGMIAGSVAFLLASRRGVRDAGICLLAIALSVLALVPAILMIARAAIQR